MTWVVVLMGIGVLGYGLWYQTTAKPDEDFVACQDGQCLWSSHIHAELHITACGEELPLAKEEGELEGLHTHKEDHRLHWHQTVEVTDAQSKMPIDPAVLTIRQSLADLDLTLPECQPGKEAVVRGVVNGQPDGDILDYRWADGDVIELVVE